MEFCWRKVQFLNLKSKLILSELNEHNYSGNFDLLQN